LTSCSTALKEIEAAGFLRGAQSVEAFALDGMLTRH